MLNPVMTTSRSDTAAMRVGVRRCIGLWGCSDPIGATITAGCKYTLSIVLNVRCLDKIRCETVMTCKETPTPEFCHTTALSINDRSRAILAPGCRPIYQVRCSTEEYWHAVQLQNSRKWAW